MIFRLTSAFLFIASTAVSLAAGPAAENFAGLTIGQTHRDIAKKVTKRENLIGPSKGVFDAAGKLTAKTFRYTGSFNRDRHVENVMLYFSSKGTLAGFDIFIKSRTTFERYCRDTARQYKKVAEGKFEGKVSAGKYAGADIFVQTVKTDAKKAKYRSYTIEVRCPAILRGENISMKEAEKKAAETAVGDKKQPVPDYLKRAL